MVRSLTDKMYLIRSYAIFQITSIIAVPNTLAVGQILLLPLLKASILLNYFKFLFYNRYRQCQFQEEAVKSHRIFSQYKAIMRINQIQSTEGRLETPSE